MRDGSSGRDYALTLHEDRLWLPARLAHYLPEGRPDQYSVYVEKARYVDGSTSNASVATLRD